MKAIYCLGLHLLFLDLFLIVNAGKKPRDYSPAIYYGDSDVIIGNPFSISCIISISDSIKWRKDGEPITTHNLRHGKDVHAFIETEHAIEGENHKIEARLSVKHALQIHEGKYQCNNNHSSYHYLRVHKDNRYGTESNLDTYSTIYTYRPRPPPSIPPERTAFPPTEYIPSNISTITTQKTHYNPSKNLYMVGHGHQTQQQHHQHQQHRITSQSPPYIYESTDFTTGDGNYMRPVGSGGSFHRGHHQKPTDFYLSSSESDVTSVDDYGMSAKPIVTTAIPRKLESELFDTTNVFSNIPPSQYQPQPQPPHFQQPPPHIQQQPPPHLQQQPPPYLQQQPPPYLQQQPPPYLQQQPPPHIQHQTPPHLQHQPPHLQQQIPHHVATTQFYVPPPTPQPTSILTHTSSSTTRIIPDVNRKDVTPTEEEKPITVFTIYRNLTLNCGDLIKSSDQEVTWERNGTDVTKDPALNGRYRISKTEHEFSIQKANIDDAGLYSCITKIGGNELRKDFRAHAQVEVRVPSNLGVVEGESLKIQCTVVGTHPKIEWEYNGNVTISGNSEQSGRYILKEDDNHIENAILEIINATIADRGEYKCIGKNKGTGDKTIGKPVEDTSYVRVKGKLAALWPFLGICAEVFILCAIILIYEKKRNKTDLDESDTDPNTEQEKLKTQRN